MVREEGHYGDSSKHNSNNYFDNPYQNSSNKNDFDDVFKSLKCNHSKLFIPLINLIFGKDYGIDEPLELISTDEHITSKFGKEKEYSIDTRISDFILKIRNEHFLLECQSYNDGSMAIRIAEYTFLSARHTATNENGRWIINMPNYSVIYIKSNSNTPKKTEITYKFPNGESVDYDSENIILTDFTKEDIIEKKLYVLIPFYILRYEQVIKDVNSTKEEIEQVVNDLNFFVDKLKGLLEEDLISGYDLENLRAYMAIILKHVTNGNKNEERLVNTMCGNVIVTEADKIYYSGVAEGEARGEARGEAKNLADRKKLSQLVKILIKDGNIEKIERATADLEYCKKLYDEYGL